ENTQSIKNSPAVALIEQLVDRRITVFDPAVRPLSQWHPRMTVAEGALACCDGADALVIMTPWPQFRSLCASELSRRTRGRVVIDPASVLDHAAAGAAGLEHVALGAPLLAGRET